METKNFLGLDGLKRFWEKAKLWIINEITTKIAEIVAEAPESFDTLKEISDWISTHKDSASAMNSNIIKNQSDINELNNKLSSIEQTNFKAIFDLVRPIGDTYVQYPQQASPMELWGDYSTWEEIKFGGVFFRSEGGDALPFTEEFKCVVAGNSIALNADDADTLEYENLLSSYDETKLIVIAGGEYRSITAWNRTTHIITLDSAFTDTSNITNVLVGQCDQFQGHIHSIFCTSSDTYLYKGGGVPTWYEKEYPNESYILGPANDGSNGYPRFGKETRSKSLTIKCWKRTA